MKSLHCFVVLFSFILLVSPVLAVAEDMENIRCGDQLVSVGDTEEDLLSKCGEPTSKERYGDECESKWIYDRSPDNFTVVFCVDGGQVSNIVQTNKRE